MRIGFLLAVLLSGLSATAQPYTLQSPDGSIRVTITAGAQMAYSIERAGQTLLNPSAIGLQIDSADIGKGAQVLRQKTRQVRDKVAVPVAVKADTLPDAYNELRLELEKATPR
ncbi:MAG: glycoside hydrolase family 97 N-terminal domain-containing protein [Haliscomenobacter sp.]|nr:glycoside hydrolase family 97 N-terminal domain-containing protein [Haliscomenobacter sp.]